MEFSFNKDGVVFSFKCLKLDDNNNLIFFYKIDGVKENIYNEDGYLYGGQYKERVFKDSGMFENVITLYDLKINGRIVEGVTLPEPYASQVSELYKSLLVERKRIFEDTANKIIEGVIPITFTIEGISPLYQSSINLIPNDLVGQERKLMAKAIFHAYNGRKHVINPVFLLNNLLNQHVTKKENLNKNAFNLQYDEKIQEFYKLKDNVVTGFDIKLMDILSEDDISKSKEIAQKNKELRKAILETHRIMM